MRNVKFTFSQQEELQRKDIYAKLQVNDCSCSMSGPCVATGDISGVG